LDDPSSIQHRSTAITQQSATSISQSPYSSAFLFLTLRSHLINLLQLSTNHLSVMSDPIIPPGCKHDVACLRENGELHYIPTLAGNAIYLSIFVLALLAQLLLGIRYRTLGFMSAMLGGCLLEIVGYTGRLLLIHNIFEQNNFIIYLIGVTLGPAFFSAALYLSLSRITAVYGNGLTWFKPRTMTIVFISGDLLSLILQSAGGALAATADDDDNSDMGVNILIGGLATQVAVTTFFLICCLQLMWAVRKQPYKVLQDTISFRRGFRFRSFLYSK
jgi:hypothetical protein